MNIGFDLGYFEAKIKADGSQVRFLSVVGTPERASFGLSTTNDSIILTEPDHVQIGAGAVRQSRSYSQREDRAWTGTHEWYQLFLAGLSETTTGSGINVNLVTGLPVAFYGDKEEMQARLTGEHKVKREGRNRQTFTVLPPRVVPQPFGSLLAMTLDNNGKVVNSELADGNIGVIDAGGKTVNILSARKLTEISRETASVNVGAWNIERAVRAYLKDEYPDLGNVRPHDLMDAIVVREIKHFGEPVDLGLVIDDTLTDVATQIIGETTRLWGAGATIDKVLITGGGAHLLGERLRSHFPPGHALVVENPAWANALGYWKLARYAAKM